MKALIACAALLWAASAGAASGKPDDDDALLSSKPADRAVDVDAAPVVSGSSAPASSVGSPRDNGLQDARLEAVPATLPAAGGPASAAASGGCREDLPSDLQPIRYESHGSFYGKVYKDNPLKHNQDGHAFLPVSKVPAGHKVGFHSSPKNGGFIAIGWSPSLGLDYPVDCAWSLWVATDDDPRPFCKCGHMHRWVNPDSPMSLYYYVTGSRQADAMKKNGDKRKLCVLDPNTRYFLYFAATGKETSQRCSTVLADTGMAD